MADNRSYWQKLQDPRWQKRKSEIQQRADFKCEVCKNGDEMLHVHHRNYKKGRQPWEYEDHELVCVCKTCHAEWEAAKAEINELIGGVGPKSLLQILGIMRAGVGISKKSPVSLIPPEPIPGDMREHVAIGVGIYCTAHYAPRCILEASDGRVVSAEAIHELRTEAFDNAMTGARVSPGAYV